MRRRQRRQHRRIQYESWMPLAVEIVLCTALLFLISTAPYDEGSGKVTDRWEDGGLYKLEIDNSFTKTVDDFEYNNIRVGETYVWEEPPDVMTTDVYIMLAAVGGLGIFWGLMEVPR